MPDPLNVYELTPIELAAAMQAMPAIERAVFVGELIDAEMRKGPLRPAFAQAMAMMLALTAAELAE